MDETWNAERKAVIRAGGSIVPRPEGTSESQRVLVTDVLARRQSFGFGGLFFIREAVEVVYVGYTLRPLRFRLRNAIANKAPWSRGDYSHLTVSMRPGSQESVAIEIAFWKPKFNRGGVTMPPSARDIVLAEVQAYRLAGEEGVALALERVAAKL